MLYKSCRELFNNKRQRCKQLFLSQWTTFFKQSFIYTSINNNRQFKSSLNYLMIYYIKMILYSCIHCLSKILISIFINRLRYWQRFICYCFIYTITQYFLTWYYCLLQLLCQRRQIFQIKTRTSRQRSIQKSQMIWMNKQCLLIKCISLSLKQIMSNITKEYRTYCLNLLWNSHTRRRFMNLWRNNSRIIWFRYKCHYLQSSRITCRLYSSKKSHNISKSTSRITRNKNQFQQEIFTIESCHKWECHLRLTCLLYNTISSRQQTNLSSHFSQILNISYSMNNTSCRQKQQSFKETMIYQMKQTYIMLRYSYTYYHITQLTSSRICNNSFHIIFQQSSCCPLQSRNTAQQSNNHQTSRRIFYLWTISHQKIYTCCYHRCRMQLCRYWSRTFHGSSQPSRKTNLTGFSSSSNNQEYYKYCQQITIYIRCHREYCCKTQISKYCYSLLQSLCQTSITNSINKKSFLRSKISCLSSKPKIYLLIRYQTYTFPTNKKNQQIFTSYQQLHSKRKQRLIREESIFMWISFHIRQRILLYLCTYIQNRKQHRNCLTIKNYRPFYILISRLKPMSLIYINWCFRQTYFKKSNSTKYCRQKDTDCTQYWSPFNSTFSIDCQQTTQKRQNNNTLIHKTMLYICPFIVNFDCFISINPYFSELLFFHCLDQNAYRKIYAIIRANSPIASVRAKPRIALLNSSLRSAGLRDTPVIREPNRIPIPIEAPPRAIQARPAPINLAAINIIK